MLFKLNLTVLKNPLIPVILFPNITSPSVAEESLSIFAKYLFSFLLKLFVNNSLEKSVKDVGNIYFDTGTKAVSPELASRELTIQSPLPS